MSSIYVNATNSTPAGDPAHDAVTGAAKALAGEQFMMLLLAQLRNQNPLEPMQDKELMGQITQLNSLQELQKMNTTLQSMKKSNQLTETVDMIGKTVEFAGDNGEILSGEVIGVSLVDDQVMLWVGDRMIPLSNVVSVSGDALNQGGA